MAQSGDDILLDFQRPARIGLEEAIFSQGKSVEQLIDILDRAAAKPASLLLTRLSTAQHEALPAKHRAQLDYDPTSRTAFFGAVTPLRGPARVAVVSAGTSDAFVAREVTRTLRYAGHDSTLVMDVGVAGVWRLLEKVELLRQHPVVVVVAGMDAALPTVVGGLVGSVLIGVPTSTGYGVATGGTTALHSMLASCAPGVVVTNIDNGYGAACAALRVLHVLPEK